MSTLRRVTMASLGAGALIALSSPSAFAATNFTADLQPLNNSGARGTVQATLDGDQLTLRTQTTGLLEGAPHGSHILIGGQNMCPPSDLKGGGTNGAVRVVDGTSYYGDIVASLTIEGDTSPASALAINRFATGNADYERTITVPEVTAEQIRQGKAVIVRHGVDLNKSGTYDGTGSELDASVPEEATDLALCGKLVSNQVQQMASGGVQTGGGSTAGVENGMVGVAAGLFAAITGAGVYRALRNGKRNTVTNQ